MEFSTTKTSESNEDKIEAELDLFIQSLMKMSIKNCLKSNMTQHKIPQQEKLKKLFLLDGVGALLTAIFLAIHLNFLNEYIGMPENVLKSLAIVALIFCVYSFSCYFMPIKNRRPYLLAIALANLVYCMATLAAVVSNYESLTVLGISYFVLEVLIVCALVRIELKAARK